MTNHRAMTFLILVLVFIPVTVWAQYTVLWTYGDFGLPGTGLTNSYFGDIDGDSQIEICYRETGGFFIVDMMTGVQEFNHDFGSQPEAITVMDLDSDGTPEVVLELQNGDLAVVDFIGIASSVPEVSGAIPRKHDLSNAYPNPFNSGTTIPVSLSVRGHVELTIYDAAGRVVRRLANESLTAGGHDIAWDGLNDGGVAVASGMYFYALRVNGQVVASKKAVVLK